VYPFGKPQSRPTRGVCRQGHSLSYQTCPSRPSYQQPPWPVRASTLCFSVSSVIKGVDICLLPRGFHSTLQTEYASEKAVARGPCGCFGCRARL
jgi:hypothetical protein